MQQSKTRAPDSKWLLLRLFRCMRTAKVRELPAVIVCGQEPGMIPSILKVYRLPQRKKKAARGGNIFKLLYSPY